MFEAIAPVCIELVRLISANRINKHDHCANILEPIFENLTQIHLDYSKGINEIVEMIEDYSESSSSIKGELEKQSQELSYLRRLVMDLNYACLEQRFYNKKYKNSPNSETKNYKEAVFRFSIAVYHYFHRTTGDPEPNRGQTWYTGLTGIISMLLKGKIDRTECWVIAIEIQEDLPRCWNEVTSAYSDVKKRLY